MRMGFIFCSHHIHIFNFSAIHFAHCRLLLEWFPVIVGMKPAVDAYRVANGVKTELNQEVEHKVMMSFVKGTELFAEGEHRKRRVLCKKVLSL